MLQIIIIYNTKKLWYFTSTKDKFQNYPATKSFTKLHATAAINLTSEKPIAAFKRDFPSARHNITTALFHNIFSTANLHNFLPTYTQNMTDLKARLHEQIFCGNFSVTNVFDRVDETTNNCWLLLNSRFEQRYLAQIKKARTLNHAFYMGDKNGSP